MLTNDDLLRRVEELDRAVAAMKNQPRRRSGWIVAIVCGMIGGWLGRSLTEPAAILAQPNNGQDLVARSLKITDDKGKPRVVLTYDEFGGIVNVLNSDGKLIVAAEGYKEGGFLRINGNDAQTRILLTIDERDRSGFMSLRAPDSKLAQAIFGVDTKGGFLSLFNTVSTKRAVWLGADESDLGGAVSIYDQSGNLHGDLRNNKFGGMLNLIGSKNGKSHVYLGTGSFDLGGMMSVRDTDGKLRAEIGQGTNGGYMFMYGNRNGSQHISMATSDDQRGGYVQVHNNAGQVKLGLGLDAAGNGYVDK